MLDDASPAANGHPVLEHSACFPINPTALNGQSSGLLHARNRAPITLPRSAASKLSLIELRPRQPVPLTSINQYRSALRFAPANRAGTSNESNTDSDVSARVLRRDCWVPQVVKEPQTARHKEDTS